MAETGWCSRSWCSRTTESTPPERPTAISALGGFLELAMAHQALEAFLDQVLRLLAVELLEGLEQRLAQRLECGLRVAVRAAERLGHDLVDQAERLQAGGGDGEGLGGLRRHARVA